MDQDTAPTAAPAEDIDAAGIPAEVPHVSPFKAHLPLVIMGAVLFLLGGATLLLFFSQRTRQGSGGTVTPPAVRPTATPILANSQVSGAPGGSGSAQSGHLAVVKDGSIYRSDLNGMQRLVQPTPPAGDKLRWSRDGSFLAWRPATATATPSALTIYRVATAQSVTFQSTGSASMEIVDYAWSPQDDLLAMVTKENGYAISIITATSSASPRLIAARNDPIRQIIWLTSDQLLFAGSDGIGSVQINTGVTSMLVDRGPIAYMSASPDGTKLLFVRGNRIKSDIFLLRIGQGAGQQLALIPSAVDMGSTALSQSVLEKGFLPFALWYPDNTRLLVGYQYRPDVPLIGVYDTTKDAFTALGVFPLLRDDTIIDGDRLIAMKSKETGDTVNWSVGVFSLRDKELEKPLYEIDGASSPAYY